MLVQSYPYYLFHLTIVYPITFIAICDYIIRGYKSAMIEEKELRLDEDIKLFADDFKRCFSKGEIEAIAKEAGFVKRKGKIKASEFVCLCCFMDVEVANNTLVRLSLIV